MDILAAQYDPPVPSASIPEGWSNDFCGHPFDYPWHAFYGSVRWRFNEVFKIPGNPRLVLIKRHRSPSVVLRQLVEVDGQFYIIEQNEVAFLRNTLQDQVVTLETVLDYLRGDPGARAMVELQWLDADETVDFIYDVWLEQARGLRYKSQLRKDRRIPKEDMWDY